MDVHKTKIIFMSLFLVSICLHLFRITTPDEVIFDEVHFGKFVSAYVGSGKHFFDIHPPHSKLIVAATASAGGYDGKFAFKSIGDDYGRVPTLALRIAPALAGSLLPAIFFILLLQLGASWRGALLGALAVLLDNALLVQTRVIALDGFLLVGIFGALSATLGAMNAEAHKRLLLLVVAGALVGLAVGTKLTGLTALAIAFVVLFLDFLTRRNFLLLFKQCSVIVVTALFVYLLGWYLHFSFLPLPGRGDLFYKPVGDFLTDTIAFHKVMFGANFGLGATHHDSSSWWSWPLMATPIYYWGGKNAGIYFLGNPAVWWGVSFSFVGLILGSIVNFFRTRTIPEFSPLNISLLTILAGFLISYLPYIAIPRVLFMYHFLPPLLFATLFVSLCFDSLFLSEEIRYRDHFFILAITAIIIGFCAILPLTYGFTWSDWYYRLVFETFPGWR